jgi:hypothetical protein
MCGGRSPEIGTPSRLRGSSRIASINSTGLGEYLQREIAMHRVEELVDASMTLVLHDWQLYRTAKEKR